MPSRNRKPKVIFTQQWIGPHTKDARWRGHAVTFVGDDLRMVKAKGELSETMKEARASALAALDVLLKEHGR